MTIFNLSAIIVDLTHLKVKWYYRWYTCKEYGSIEPSNTVNCCVISNIFAGILKIFFFKMKHRVIFIIVNKVEIEYVGTRNVF